MRVEIVGGPYDGTVLQISGVGPEDHLVELLLPPFTNPIPVHRRDDGTYYIEWADMGTKQKDCR